MAERSVAPMPVPEEAALSGLPRPFDACAQCGFLGIRPAGSRDWTWSSGASIGSNRWCPRCGHKGLPVEFDSPADYCAFLAHLHEQTPA